MDQCHDLLLIRIYVFKKTIFVDLQNTFTPSTHVIPRDPNLWNNYPMRDPLRRWYAKLFNGRGIGLIGGKAGHHVDYYAILTYMLRWKLRWNRMVDLGNREMGPNRAKPWC